MTDTAHHPAPVDYTRGEMDISEHKSTYGFFGRLAKWGSLVAATGMLFFTLWFCTKAGFLGALFTAVIVAALGVFFLRDKKPAAH
jgi:hypothetical protein